MTLLSYWIWSGKITEDSLHVTAADSILGTPHYMPPEVMTSQELDARSDLYSLGGVAYYLLTAKTVFDGKNIAEVCMKHAKDQPVPPSERLGKPIAADLEQLVLSCLAKDRDARPQTATPYGMHWTAVRIQNPGHNAMLTRGGQTSWPALSKRDDFRMGDTNRQTGELTTLWTKLIGTKGPGRPDST